MRNPQQVNGTLNGETNCQLRFLAAFLGSAITLSAILINNSRSIFGVREVAGTISGGVASLVACRYFLSLIPERREQLSQEDGALPTAIREQTAELVQLALFTGMMPPS